MTFGTNDPEPKYYWWFLQDDWLDGSSPNEDLDFPEDFDRSDFEEWLHENYPGVSDREYRNIRVDGAPEDTDNEEEEDEDSDEEDDEENDEDVETIEAIWLVFDPELGYGGFQKLIDEYAESLQEEDEEDEDDEDYEEDDEDDESFDTDSVADDREETTQNR